MRFKTDRLGVMDVLCQKNDKKRSNFVCCKKEIVLVLQFFREIQVELQRKMMSIISLDGGLMDPKPPKRYKIGNEKNDIMQEREKCIFLI